MKKCTVYPMREGCYKEGDQTKSDSVTIKSEEHLEQEAFQETEAFKNLYQERYKIEAKNSELKNRHGLKRARSAGLFGMQMEATAVIIAVNIKRIIKLIDEKNAKKQPE